MSEHNYALRLTDDGPYNRPLAVYRDGERVLNLDLQYGPFHDGPAPNLSIGASACEKVFDGHYWTRPELQLRHEREMRICGLCGKRQKKVDYWEDIE